MKSIKISECIAIMIMFLFCTLVNGQVQKSKIRTDSYKDLSANFQNPPAEYSTAPFWVWNEKITKQGIDEQLTAYNTRGIHQVILHPRPGLITPYLSKEWMDLVKYSVEKAKKLGMKIWLYDENSYPSGFAGGEVPAQLPEVAGKMLQLIKANSLKDIKQEVAFILKKDGDNFKEIKAAEMTGNEEYFIFVYQPAGKGAWYGGYSYVDLMQRKTTEKFIEVTHQQYVKVLGKEIGKTVPGIFTDEPNIHPAGGANVISYTPALFDQFKKKWGYDLKTNMALLFEETGIWKKVRHDYYATLLELFTSNWAKPLSEFCANNNFALTGHYWDHNYPLPDDSPDNMAMAAYSQVPGIDLLMNQWDTHPYSQFGNNHFVREVKSAANQMGRTRTLSETYGAAGWDLTFNDMKRIGDWEYALGINLMNQHLSYYSITGSRKRDHPNSFSYHSPYWDDYKLLADYYSRLSMVMSKGVQQNNILVIQPTTTAWMYYNSYSSYNNTDPNSDKNRPFNKLAVSFFEFVNALEDWQIEYDFGSEDIIRKHGCTENEYFKVGSGIYNLVIIPPFTDNLDKITVNLLEKYLDGGGKVLSTNVLPTCVDGAESNLVKELAEKYSQNWKQVHMITRPDIVSMTDVDVAFSDVTPQNFVFHQTRTLDDVKTVFIANTSDTQTAEGKFTIAKGSVEMWDCFTGNKSPYPFTVIGDKIEVSFNIPACGSLLLCIKPDNAKSINSVTYSDQVINFTDALKIKANKPNVLTIDFCDLKIGDKTWNNLYFYQAQVQTFKAVGMPKSPWDNSVQYKSNVIDNNNFPKESGFSADYNLTIDEGTDLKGMKLVSERPKVFQVFVNGSPVKAEPGKYFLDKDFGVYDISKLVKYGENKITVKVSPMSIYAELEAVYILGNFSLFPKEFGFKLVPAKNITLGPWNEQGMQLYGDKVIYSHTMKMDSDKGKYIVKLDKWAGSCAEVYVNDKKAGIIGFAPYELDVTKFMKKGSNEIKVAVVGTLRNTLGPHHTYSKGSCWPGMFQTVAKDYSLAGKSYATNPYGLFEDFKIIHRTETK